MENSAGVSYFQNDWANHTTLHPLGLAVLLISATSLLLVPRRFAVWPIFVIVLFVASAQRLIIFGADFDFLRILSCVGILRVLINREYSHFRVNRVDVWVVAWTIVAFAMPVIRLGPGSGVFVTRLGFAVDVLGQYFLFRFLFRDWDDVLELSRCLAILAIPVSAFFMLESSTGRNLFAVLGGLPEITPIRDGRLRCQGAFGHSILAGCFWAAAMPVIAMQWWRKRRILVGFGCICALFIVYASASATPLLCVLAVVSAAFLYFVRKYVWLLRWGVVATLIVLHFSMEAPVWHLIARTGFLGGSSWHRYVLVNGAITHFHEWWLMGSSIGTAHWGHFAFDVTNYYIVQAVHGGVLQLAMFIGLIVVVFMEIGRTIRRRDLSKVESYMVWAVGVAAFGHAVNWFGVSYFGQIWAGWYAVLGIVANLPRLVAKDSERKGALVYVPPTTSSNWQEASIR